MIYQSNYTPVFIFLIIILIGAVVMGLLLTDTEIFNPTRAAINAHASETSSALAVDSTRVILGATQTPLALQGQLGLKQTLAATNATEAIQTVVAQRTAIPVAQTATQAAVILEVRMAQGRATQTAIGVDSSNRLFQAQATQTAVLSQQTLTAGIANATSTRVALGIQEEIDKRQLDQAAEIVKIVLIVTASVMAIVVIICCSVMVARTKHSEAVANQFRERRRMLEVEAAFQLRGRQNTTEPKIIALQQFDTPSNQSERNMGEKGKVGRAAR